MGSGLAARAGFAGLLGTEARVEEVARPDRRLQHARDLLAARGRRTSPIAEATIPLDHGSPALRIVASAHRRRITAAKEPFTVSWLERSLDHDAVLYDVGANVGGYSLIAASASAGARVIAFEPAYKNYAALCDNVVVNGFGDRITPIPVALGARTTVGAFRYRRPITGGARHDSHGAGELDWAPEYEHRTPAVAYGLFERTSVARP